MRFFGIAIVVAALLAPLAGFGPLALRHDPIAIVSECAGAAALIAMALGQILATRLRILEPVFGGLDRIYVLHKWLGIGAMAAILLHDTLDAEAGGVGGDAALTDLAETFGEVSLYGLLILAIITVATFIPYRLWYLTHKFMGAFFAVALLHFALIAKPFATLDPLGLYIMAFGAAGVLSYLYTLLPRGQGSGWRSHRVVAVDRTRDAMAVTLEPDRRSIGHRAGQFAFVRFELPGLSESHPFTISKAPDADGLVRFTIKALGGYTRALNRELEVGSHALVSPPYGRFFRRRGAKREIWIAGGIGITPFVAWAQALEPDHSPIDLFLCVRGLGAAAHLDELNLIALSDPRFTVHLVDSTAGDRLTAERIAETASLVDAQVHFCGPKGMRETLRTGLCERGLRSSCFHYEMFEIRSGLGLRRLAQWLVSLPPSFGVFSSKPKGETAGLSL